MKDYLGFWGDRPGQAPADDIKSAHRPWLVEDRPYEAYRQTEPQSSIDKCLTCKIRQKYCRGEGVGCKDYETRGGSNRGGKRGTKWPGK